MEERVTKAVVAGAGLLAAYTYGVSYLALADYYRPFGLTPEDAGVTQTTLVPRAATSFLVFGAAFMIFALAAVSAFSSARRQDWRRWWLAGTGLVVGGLVVALSKVLPGWVVVPFVPMALGGIVGLVAGAFNSGPESAAELAREHRVLVVLAVLVLGYLVAAYVDSGASHMGRQVLEHGAVGRIQVEDMPAHFALGIDTPAADAPGFGCVHVIARSGNRAWVLVGGPSARRVHAVPTTDLVFHVAGGCS